MNTKHDSWLTTSPEDEEDERNKAQADENARQERMLDAAEDGNY
jgi:hypothetical protein|tara:strand:+ start:7858 stop:7989 length:132 start_codon:yes stop_codon:yes gene_type:complete